MSGIVGLSRGREGLDVISLRDMIGAQAFRGPDGCAAWNDDVVGLGHSLLATTHEAVRERQPCSVDGGSWITADIRLDGRQELIASLRDRGCSVDGAAVDPDLVLHAYREWGTDCVDHLIGDFAFGIWDQARQRLLLARDRFGVKPMFYARSGGGIIFGNTLDVLRRHPGVGDALDDLTIADYLLFKYNQRPGATGFSGIHRLPPASRLTWTEARGERLDTYWRLPVNGDVRFRQPREYIERFQELFSTAVADRLRTDRAVSVSMSGGLDSTAIAAAASRLVPASTKIVPHTMVFDRLVPDDERAFAEAAGAALGLPIRCFVADAFMPFARDAAPMRELPEPGDSTFRDLDLQFTAALATTGRVALSGMDADSFLSESTLDYFTALVSRWRWPEAARATVRHWQWTGRRPPIGARQTMRRLFQARQPRPELPPWIARDLVRDLDLHTRWREFQDRPRHALSARPRASRAAASTLWTTVFERGDAGSTGQPLEFRYPFTDLRLVNFLTAIPLVPWCVDKTLLREALRGVLPDAVRLRKKTPLAIDPLTAALARSESRWIDDFVADPELTRYVNRAAVPRVTGGASADVFAHVRPFCLNRWLGHNRGRLTRSMNHVHKAEVVIASTAALVR